VGQFDVEAALRRHLVIPQTWDRRYSIKSTHYCRVNSEDLRPVMLCYEWWFQVN
jgi:hypothetical protein